MNSFLFAKTSVVGILPATLILASCMGQEEVKKPNRRCVVIHDAPSFFSLTIKIGSFSLSCDILRISLVYVFATSK